MSEQRLAGYHAYAREHGVNRAVPDRAADRPAGVLDLFRLARYGREHAHLSGPLLVAANHRSFLDLFVIAITSRGGARCTSWPRSSCSISAGRAGSSPGSARSRSAAASPTPRR